MGELEFELELSVASSLLRKACLLQFLLNFTGRGLHGFQHLQVKQFYLSSHWQERWIHIGL
jgi:hypothetical protein